MRRIIFTAIAVLGLGVSGCDRDRGDNATVDTLERCPLVVDVRPEAMFTELRDGGGVRPVHVRGAA